MAWCREIVKYAVTAPVAALESLKNDLNSSDCKLAILTLPKLHRTLAGLSPATEPG